MVNSLTHDCVMALFVYLRRKSYRHFISESPSVIQYSNAMLVLARFLVIIFFKSKKNRKKITGSTQSAPAPYANGHRVIKPTHDHLSPLICCAVLSKQKQMGELLGSRYPMSTVWEALAEKSICIHLHLNWTLTWCLCFSRCVDSREEKKWILCLNWHSTSRQLKTLSLFSDFSEAPKTFRLIKTFYFSTQHFLQSSTIRWRTHTQSQRTNETTISVHLQMEFFLFSQVACIMRPALTNCLLTYYIHFFSFFNFLLGRRRESQLSSGYVLFICLLFYQFHSLKNTFTVLFEDQKKKLRWRMN